MRHTLREGAQSKLHLLPVDLSRMPPAAQAIPTPMGSLSCPTGAEEKGGTIPVIPTITQSALALAKQRLVQTTGQVQRVKLT